METLGWIVCIAGGILLAAVIVFVALIFAGMVLKELWHRFEFRSKTLGWAMTRGGDECELSAIGFRFGGITLGIVKRKITPINEEAIQHKLILLADWLDREQEAGRWNSDNNDVQNDLRVIARALEDYQIRHLNSDYQSKINTAIMMLKKIDDNEARENLKTMLDETIEYLEKEMK